MEARRSKNFIKFYKSTGERSVNIRGHVRLTLLGLYLGWTNQPVTSTRASSISRNTPGLGSTYKK
jgi:hypothetical protein